MLPSQKRELYFLAFDLEGVTKQGLRDEDFNEGKPERCDDGTRATGTLALRLV